MVLSITSSYQIRDLQKQIIAMRKQRADDSECLDEQVKDLKKQLIEKDLQIDALQAVFSS